MNSPTLKPKNSKLKRKSRPHLRRLISGPNKLVFSVDDDIDDINAEEVLDREYIEGYNDAIRTLLKKKELQSPDGYFDVKIDDNDVDNIKRRLINEESLKSLDSAIVKPDQKIKLEASKSDNTSGSNGEPSSNLVTRQFENIPNASLVNTPLIEGDEAEDDEGIEPDNASMNSSSSSDTIESLNLRERQDAINSTHPFGIKIWKPSLYKKNRSVAARAEEDIHDYSENRPSGIHWGVHVTNFIWSITFGLLIFLVCLFCSASLFLMTGFGIKKNLRLYVKFIYNLGIYWLHPFGKFVILNKDENYLDEDDIYGSSFGEFHQWRNEDEGRLFFAPPRRQTNSAESKPLLKDHKGRTIRESYSFMNEGSSNDANDQSIIIDDDEEGSRNDTKVRFFGRGRWTWSRVAFYVLFYGIMQPIFYLIGGLCWLGVFTIPMTNVTTLLCSHIKKHPLALHFQDEKSYYKIQHSEQEQRKNKNQSILLCTYRCSGLHYYKYTIDGTNVFFFNLLSAVVFVIFDFYVLKEKLELKMFITEPAFIFCACLFSTIPLAFFIGQAVASISAQSSMGVGAVINALFSTIVEIFLYCIALTQSKAKIVEGGMIGSILGGVLLLPGLSMCAGAFKRKTQRYNPRSAGVSSTMLLFGMVTMFAPSLFYQIYGSYELRCKECEITITQLYSNDCVKCRFIQPPFALDNLYYLIIRPFSLTVAIALLVSYGCGLLFTLRTHASLIWATSSTEHATHKKEDDISLRSPSIVSLDKKPKPVTSIPALSERIRSSSKATSALPSPSLDVTKQRFPKTTAGTPKQKPSDVTTPVRKSSIKDEEDEEEAGGHDAPNWSRSKSSFILMGATILYSIIAEILVDVVDDVLQSYPLNPKFLGLTVFALVPNTTEFLNAISFALSGNVALSMEIGSAYALQVVLIQIPILAIFSIFQGFQDPYQIFSLVFPRWDIIATLISIYLFTYIYAEGKSNYFKGVILILIYAVVLVGFWLNDAFEDLNDGYNTAPGVLPLTFNGY